MTLIIALIVLAALLCVSDVLALEIRSPSTSAETVATTAVETFTRFFEFAESKRPRAETRLSPGVRVSPEPMRQAVKTLEAEPSNQNTP
jgi:hypothetical protein